MLIESTPAKEDWRVLLRRKIQKLVHAAAIVRARGLQRKCRIRNEGSAAAHAVADRADLVRSGLRILLNPIIHCTNVGRDRIRRDGLHVRLNRIEVAVFSSPSGFGGPME